MPRSHAPAAADIARYVKVHRATGRVVLIALDARGEPCEEWHMAEGRYSPDRLFRWVMYARRLQGEAAGRGVLQIVP
jgi:hypothetical protein